MRKKLSLAVGATALALLMSSCFVVQSFTVLDYTLKPGQATKAQFTLRPSNADNAAGVPFNGPHYQFVLLGVPNPGDLTALTAKWGTNGLFGGPLTMAVNGGLVAAIGGACGSFGLDLTDITGVTWKGFITPVKIRDRNQFEKKAIVQVGFKAQADAVAGDNWQVFGVAGDWIDDGDDTLSGGDFFACAGIESATVQIIPA
jgi:hypothetical protein